MSRLFKSAYEPKNLLKTNVAASGILLLLGDIIQQNIELYRGVHEKGEERMVTKTSAYNDDISLYPPTFVHFLLCDNLVNRNGCHRTNFCHNPYHMGQVLKHDRANLQSHGHLDMSQGLALHMVDSQLPGPRLWDPSPPTDQRAWRFPPV